MKLYHLNLVLILVLVLSIYSGELFAQKKDKYVPFAQVMPKPVGGIQSIYKHIQYPEMAKNAGVEGKVYLQVFISKNGNVDNVKVLKGIGAGCDQAAIKGIKEIKFSPGENNGKPVKVKLALPITFKLNN